MPDRHFGAIPGVPVGATFESRDGLAQSGVHRPPRAGICGSNDGEGAESIVLSGGYVDDMFAWDYIVYTGQGGQGSGATARTQVCDQPFNHVNASLALCTLTGRPVRASRKVMHRRESVYCYEGLYRVNHYRYEHGLHGFRVWRFYMTRLSETDARAWGETWPGDAVADPDEPPGGGLTAEPPSSWQPAPRAAVTTQRLVRDTDVGRRVKAWHGHRCQTCGTRLDTPAGPYAEAAHVRPLGRPHDGPDVPANVLCLCPSCHVRFDAGAFALLDGGEIVTAPGCEGSPLLPLLRRDRRHALDAAHLAYHREHVFHGASDAA